MYHIYYHSNGLLRALYIHDSVISGDHMIFGNGCDNAGDSTVECGYEITQESRVVASHECRRKLEG